MRISHHLSIFVLVAGLLPTACSQRETESFWPDAEVARVGRIPETDAGLPGSGPIRRYDWFQKIWRTRRVTWAHEVKKDQGAVVFLGDSITHGWGDDMGNSFPGLKVANRGISGDTTRGVLIRLQEDVLTLHPRAVVLLIGTNDLEEGADPDTIAGNVRLILAALEAPTPDMPIILCKVFPSSASQNRPKEKIEQINQLYAALAKEHPQVMLIDTWTLFADANGDALPSEFPDLLHPNKAGYDKWAAALKPVFEQLHLLPTVGGGDKTGSGHAGRTDATRYEFRFCLYRMEYPVAGRVD